MIDRNVLRVMNELFKKGYTTEKAIAAFDIRNQLELELTTRNDTKIIVELKDAVKQGKVISYLSGELNKTEDIKQDTKQMQTVESKPENRFL